MDFQLNPDKEDHETCGETVLTVVLLIFVSTVYNMSVMKTVVG